MILKRMFFVIVLGVGSILSACVPPKPVSTPAFTNTPLPPIVTMEPTATAEPTPTLLPIETPIPEPEITIREPYDGVKVDHTQMVKGTSANLPEGSVIWLVIYVHEVDRYFPHKSAVTMEAGGSWSSITFIGREDEAGLKVDILAVLADQSAQAEFESYNRAAGEAESFEGIAQLPEGSLTYQRITFERK